MALGKIRSNKRPSSNSYSSTITTVIFVALCVLGVWMLSSNSVAPPQTTSRTATTTNSGNGGTSSSVSAITSFFSSKEPEDKENSSPFDDNPGDLPEDAIKSDDIKTTQDNVEGKSRDTVDPKSTEHDGVFDKQISSLMKENAQADQKQQQEQKDSISVNSEEVKPNNENRETISQQFDQSQKEYGSDVVTHSQEQQDQPLELVQPISNSSNGNSSEAIHQFEDETHMAQVALQNDVERQKPVEQDIHQETKVSTGGGFEGETHIAQTAVQNDVETQIPVEQDLHQETKVSTGGGFEGEKHIAQAAVQNDVEMQKPLEQDVHQETKAKVSAGGGLLESSAIPKESKESKRTWSTQKAQSENEKERRKDDKASKESIYGYTWQLCNVTEGPDYIPCLDNKKAIKKVTDFKHFQHRERHCPDEGPTCLVPLPEGYKRSLPWPQSRDKIWYHKVPHTLLAEVKGHQNWVKVTGEFLTFPGGGTQFKHGALHYIDYLQQSLPGIAWGKHTRVVLDVGCGVASFGGFLFDRNVLAMSFAPKDEHEAQVQFALERGIPAISAVMGSQRLPFPSNVFDLVHCARCRVPWHQEGGTLLLELNRVLRSGGYFVWSATPVYQKLEEDVGIWKAMTALTAAMCWELVTIKLDKLNSASAAIYRKPLNNECYDKRDNKSPPMCKDNDDPNAAWYVPLQTCMHRVPVEPNLRGSQWPKRWPHRVSEPPYWLNATQMGIYGKPAPQDFTADYEHWRKVVNNTYLNGLGLNLSTVRNVMDMRSVYGGFAGALMKVLNVWVLNVVNIDSPDTLPIIYERGLFGIYHDWCESFSTYPRTYDLLHADHLFSRLKKRCKIGPVMAEVDRIVRPGGKLIVRDESGAIGEVENLLKSLHWEVHLTFSKNQEGLLSAQKGDWRPLTYADKES